MGFASISGGGGAGTPGPPGPGVAPGGTTGQLLAKASNADFDTVWITVPLFFYFSGGTLTVDGTEASGFRFPTIVVPATVLPPGAFYWVVQSNGYGTYFATNIGGITGTPSGQYIFDTWDGAAWVQTASFSSLTNLAGPDLALIRAGVSGAGGSRIFRYDPAVLNEIRFSLRVSSAPTSAFTANVGLEGYILGQ